MARIAVSLARLKEGIGYRPDFSRGTFYLDRVSGDVEYLNDPDAKREREKGRDLLAVEPIPESEELRWMAEFAESRRAQGKAEASMEERVEERAEEKLEEWRRLVTALNGATPVRQFNAVLVSFEETKSAWSRERERRLLEAAARWLDSLGGGYVPE